jgi:flagellar FliL protein
MAEKAAPKAEEGAAPVKKKKPLLLIIIAVVVLALAGGGAWFFLGKKADGEDDEEKAEAPHGAPVFVTLEPFTVNLAPAEGESKSEHYLQVGIDLEVSGKEIEERIKTSMPKIKSNIVLLLTSKTPSDLANTDGKNQLREEIAVVVNKAIGVKVAAGAVEAAAGSEDAKPAEGEKAEGEKAAEGDEDKPKKKKKKVKAPAFEGVSEVLLTSFIIQ